MLELDVRRCRRSAMAHSAHPWSVFCALDNIAESTPGELGDFSFVTHVLDGRKSRLSVLPFVGAMWYHRCSVEWLLHHGLIDWGCISHSFTSAGHLPPDAFKDALDRMDAAWDDDAQRKLSVLHMIGLWASDKQESYSVTSSFCEGDAFGQSVRRFEFAGGVVYDVYKSLRRKCNTSTRPIWDQIMAWEHTRVAQLLFAIQALGEPARCISDVKTDAVVVCGFPRHLQEKAGNQEESISSGRRPGVPEQLWGAGCRMFPAPALPRG